MSSESISDKLRRWADESKNKQRNIYLTLNAGEDFGINLNQKDFIIECEFFHRIADEMDREIAVARKCTSVKSSRVSPRSSESRCWKTRQSRTGLAAGTSRAPCSMTAIRQRRRQVRQGFRQRCED